MAAQLARRLLKIILFIALFALSAKMIDVTVLIKADEGIRFAHWLYGEATAENADDLLFFAGVGISLITACIGYLFIMLIIKKTRVVRIIGQHR